MLPTLVLLLMWAALAAADTTVLMYMCGSDLQENCLADIEEMCQVNLHDEVHLVVLAGGTKAWADDRLADGQLNLLTIEDGAMRGVTPLGKASMGDPSTLVAFVQRAMDSLPSERTVLVLWDHGGGSQYGVCYDEVFDDDCLTLAEMDQAMEQLRQANPSFHLNVVGMDACLMAGFEVASVFAPYADYLVASEEVEPATGWDYAFWLSRLSEQPSMSDEALCLSVIDAYQAAYDEDSPEDCLTLSAIRLSAMDELTARMEALAVSLSTALDQGHLSTISRIHQRMNIFGSFADASSDMVDLRSLIEICSQFDTEAAQSAEHALERAVVRSYASASVPAACGLSAFLPLEDRSSIREILPGYSVRSAYPNYVSFVTGYAEQMLTSSYAFGAGAPAQVDRDTLTGAEFAQSIASIGFIPGVIESSFGPAAQATRPPFVAGTDPDALPAAPPAPGQTAGGVPGFIAGSASAYVETPTVTQDSLAFSLALSADAMANLSYAEGMLLMDLSDEDGVFLLDMGYLQNAWIDWQNQTVYSMFDGTWPMLGGQLVTMYDQAVTPTMRRSLIPALVNGEETYLVVVFEQGRETGRIIGHNAGYDDRGLPIRGTTRLCDGDIITPRYTMYFCTNDELEDDSDLHEDTYAGESFVWHAGLEVVYGSLRDDSEETAYLFEFVLNDIFGDSEISDPISFTL